VPRWRKILRIVGAIIALSVVAYWAASGSNTGWTKDKTAVMKTDEITGIQYAEYQDHFVPGIELLGLGTGFGLALIAISFFPSKKTKHTS
jgi:hypothetical protein